MNAVMQIKQMIAFIDQEASEKAEEIDSKVIIVLPLVLL